MGTALITGASSGLGEEFAWQLAADRHDLVLVARRRERLEALAATLHATTGVTAEVLAADLATDEGRRTVAQRLAVGTVPNGERAQPPSIGQLAPIGLLVNNAGCAAGPLLDSDRAQQDAAADLMVRAVLDLSAAAARQMVSRGRGAIITVSSLAAFTAASPYSAHKAWQRTFSEALARDLAGTGVTATVTLPGPVRTDFHRTAGPAVQAAAERLPGWLWLTPAQVVSQTLAAARRGAVSVTPSLRYAALAALAQVTPRALLRRAPSTAPPRLASMADSKRRRPTVRDVAEAAGVSRGTVSRMLNGGKWVSSDAAARVEAAIKATGYQINPHARSLTTQRTSSVAFLLTEPHHLLFDDPNFSTLARGASRELSARDMTLVLLVAGTRDERRHALDFVTAGHVDGVMCVSAHMGDELLPILVRNQVPVVASGPPLGHEEEVSYVAADDRRGALEATRYLMDLGRERIASVTGPADAPGSRARLTGFREALGPRAEDDLIVTGDYSVASGRRAAAQLMDSPQAPDAIFAANDAMARGVVDELLARGVRVPQDVAVIGFDDSSFATSANPLITTMRQPFERISQLMVRVLVDQISGGEPATVYLPTTLVTRETA